MRVPFAVVLIALVGSVAIGLGAALVFDGFGASSQTQGLVGGVVAIGLVSYVIVSTDRRPEP